MGAGHDSRATGKKRAKIFGLIVAISSAVAFAASPFGCGLDDSAVPQLGGADASITDTGTLVDESGKPIGDGGDGDVVVCTPETCTSYPSVCRSGLPNKCGGEIDCTNACPTGQACITDSGTCDGPPVCQDAGEPGGNCGEIVNPGNGLDASCASCSNSFACVASTCTCSGTVCGTECCNGAMPNCSTTPNTCCKTTTCAPGTCNPSVPQACGGTLNCSANCSAGTQCGTNGYVCDVPPTCTNQGLSGGNCGTLTSTHGVMTNCGSCTVANETCTNNICGCATPLCGGACCATGMICDTANNTCCNENTMAMTCNNKCGTVIDNCGVSVNCGDCSVGDVCNGTSCTCDQGGGGGNSATCSSGDSCCHGMGNYYCHNPGCF